MPKRPPRKAVAPVKDAFLGYRDKIGEVFRSGKDVFVLAVHEQWGKTIPAGAVPARLHKLFGYEGDKLKAYRLDSKYLWCINYPMLQALGQYVLEKIPADILAMMAADHRLVVETNWGVSNAFETVDQDVEMAGFFAPAIPPGAWKHVGKLMLALTPAGNLRKHGGVNYATGFRAWTEQSNLASFAPNAARPDTAGLPQPCTADYSHAPQLPCRVATGGGPGLDDGETVEVGADELIIRAVEYDAEYVADDPLADFSTGYAYITGNPYDDPLTGIEMFDHRRLSAMMLDLDTDDLAPYPGGNAATGQLLDEPDHDKRVYLNGAKELLPGWREVSFPRAAIRRSVVSVNPTLTEGTALIRGDADTYSFECAVRQGCALVPLRRCGDTIARTCLPSLMHPSARAVRGMAQSWLQDVLVQKTKAAERNLDPLEFTVPCPFNFVVSLPGFAAMRRWLLPPAPSLLLPLPSLLPAPILTAPCTLIPAPCSLSCPPSPAILHLVRSPKQRHVLTHILASSDDADTIIGMLGWHAPIGKEKNGFFLICVPEPPDTINDGATIDPRRVSGLKKHQYNFISYDTEAQALTVRLSVARFNASLRVRGASVGKPPEMPPPGGGKWKYSLYERAWVPGSVRAPTPRQLKERYPAGPSWMHW
jgi:hypothetical protein